MGAWISVSIGRVGIYAELGCRVGIYLVMNLFSHECFLAQDRDDTAHDAQSQFGFQGYIPLFSGRDRPSERLLDECERRSSRSCGLLNPNVLPAGTQVIPQDTVSHNIINIHPAPSPTRPVLYNWL